MPLLRAEAEKLSNNTLVQGIVEEIIDRDNFFAFLPFTKVNSKALVYNRENTLAGADFLDPNETINEEASTFTEVTAKLRILAGDVDVDKFLMETMGDTNDQVATQIMQKAKGVGRIFQAQVANGDAAANTKAFDGLPKLVDPSMTFAVATNGGPVTLDLLDQLRDMVKLGARRPGDASGHLARHQVAAARSGRHDPDHGRDGELRLPDPGLRRYAGHSERVPGR